MKNLYYCEINIFCIVIISILLMGIRKMRRNVRDELYRGVLISTIVFCISDIVAGCLRGTFYSFSLPLLWVSNITYFISTFILAELWLVYSMYILTGKINKNAVVMTSLVAFAASIFFITTPWHGLAFTISKDNLYQRGPLLWIQYGIIFPNMIMPSVIAPFTKAAAREKRAVAAFALFPFISVVIQIACYGVSICQVGLVGAILMLYVMYQSEIVNEAEARAKLLDEISNTDFLTQLKNRRAFEVCLVELESAEWVGAIYSDLNGLKKENDTNGHKAGDLLISKYASLLKSYFSEKEIFRVSGDEFVVLTEDKENFESKYEGLCNHAGDLASVGACEGHGVIINSVIAKAEKEMYLKKDEFYKRTDCERRTW